MSRYAPGDQQKTRDRLNRDCQYEKKSWLRHRGKRGSVIDHLLLRGATMQEMIEESGAKNENSVRGHLSHLYAKHRLSVLRDRDGRYYFGFDQQEEADDQQPTDDDLIEEVPAQNPAKYQTPEKRQGISTESSISPRADRPPHWGAVMLDEQSCFKPLLGNIPREARDNIGKMLLVIKGPNLENIKTAINMIVKIASSYDPTNIGTWSPGCSWPPRQYYVYRHQDNQGVFYVGKGIQQRGEAHVIDAINVLNDNSNQAKTRKHQRILAAIQDGRDSSASLADYKRRSIFSYPMPISECGEMMAFLAEDFIITHLHGVYGLTNETGGNSRSHGYTWLSQPKNSMESPCYWAEACNYFLETRRMSSAAWAKLTKINADSLMALEPDAIMELREIDGITVGEHALRGQDVFIDVALHNMPFRIQLLFSSKNPTVKFNVRPARNPDGKITRIERVAFECAYKKVVHKNRLLGWNIRIQNTNDCYIKPFVQRDQAKKDPSFSILDLEQREAIDLPGLDENALELNLIEAVRHVRLIFCEALNN